MEPFRQLHRSISLCPGIAGSCRHRRAAVLLAVAATLGTATAQEAQGARVYPVRIYDAASGQLVRTLAGHTGRVVSLAFSPDGRWLASAADEAREVDEAVMVRASYNQNYYVSDSGVRLWEVATGREVGQIPRFFKPGGGWEPRQAIAFSADGSKLATGTQFNLRWWALPSLQALTTWEVKAPVFAIDPKGQRMATVVTWPGKEIRVIDAASGQMLHTFPFPKAAQAIDVPSLAFDASGELLVATLVGDRNQGRLTSGLLVWDAVAGKALVRVDDPMDNHTSNAVALLPEGRAVTPTQVVKLLEGRKEKAWDHGTAGAVAADPQGRWLATIGGHQPVRIVDLASGKVLREIDGPDVSAASVAVSPDGRLLAIGGDFPLMAEWSASHLLASIREPAKVYQLRFSSDGRQVLFMAGQQLRRWDPATGSTSTVFQGSKYQYGGEPSPDGRLAIFFTKDSVLVANFQTGSIVLALPCEKAALSPKGNFLAAATLDGTVRIVDLLTRRQVGQYKNGDRVKRLAWHPEEKLLVTSGLQSKNLIGWDAGTGQPAWEVKAAGSVDGIAWQKDGSAFASAEGTRLFLRDGATGAPRQEIPLKSSGWEVGWHPQQPWVLLTRSHSNLSNSIVKVVDMTTGEERYRLADHTNPGQAEFSPDGRWLATSNRGADLRVYDGSSGRLAAVLDPSDIDGVFAFNADGTRLVTGGSNGRLRLWSLSDLR